LIDSPDSQLPSLIDEVSLWSSYFGSLLLEELRLRPGLRLLDLGCGSGFPLLELAQRLGVGGSSRVLGIDPWAAAVRRARWRADRLELGRVGVVQGDGARMPFPAASFDVIVSNLGVNNFERPEAVFAECGRVTRPGGCLALTTNPAGHLQEFYDLFAATLIELDLRERLPVLDRHVAHRLTADRIEALLRGAGFASVRRVARSFTMGYADGTAFFSHFLTRRGFLDGWRSVLEPGQQDAVFARMETALNQRAAAKGPLAMTVPMLYLEAAKA
jgi:ubiquinone/menaquinone biosynthesis C-methylase UbiE